MSIDRFLRALRRFYHSTRWAASCKASSKLLTGKHLATERIRWAFFMECAPWFWKRMVRLVKSALRKTLRTVLCEVEAGSHNRPFTLVSSGAQDKLALTAAHFLIGRSLAALPVGNGGATSTDMKNLFRRWTHKRKVVAHLWKRWRREYVAAMSRREMAEDKGAAMSGRRRARW
ncbi:hypothetical protein T4D_1210 [Trichinella pseudospiralis]|uniref:Uncharacterized protein n=1 Tax=Trichinella pseudospiralis TaxID=6337 RepID=A0A0V1FYL6_TRIPS|nr:hypothetical protein T4D_1210 [Trichinella pseudospiralis]